MSESSFKITILIIWITLSCVIQHNCYGEEIKVKCSSSYKVAKAHSYQGGPGKTLTLITKGFKIANHDELITSDNDQLRYLHVSAICFGTDQYGDHWGERFDMLELEEPLPKLHCKKGEEIRITFKSPNSSNPNKYQYVGELITSNDDEDEEKEEYKNTEEKQESKLPKQRRNKKEPRPGSPHHLFVSPPHSRSSSSNSINDLDLNFQALGSISGPPSQECLIRSLTKH